MKRLRKPGRPLRDHADPLPQPPHSVLAVRKVFPRSYRGERWHRPRLLVAAIPAQSGCRGFLSRLQAQSSAHPIEDLLIHRALSNQLILLHLPDRSSNLPVKCFVMTNLAQPLWNEIFRRDKNRKLNKSKHLRPPGGWGATYSNLGRCWISEAGTDSSSPPARIHALIPPSITFVWQFSCSSMCATRLLVVSRMHEQ